MFMSRNGNPLSAHVLTFSFLLEVGMFDPFVHISYVNLSFWFPAAFFIIFLKPPNQSLIS